MRRIPFVKLHGAENDFLLTWAGEAPARGLSTLARKICARSIGIGADGWMLVARTPGGLLSKLFNSDGSEPEISGNGTRCAAAFALYSGVVPGPQVIVETRAGAKSLRLIDRKDLRFTFEMAMGVPRVEELRTVVRAGSYEFDATLLNVGNPQCAVFADPLPPDWRAAAREIESHERFPKRTNVSFTRVINTHTVETVFYERGAGETRSSGTGSTAAAAAAILRGETESPVEVWTPAGPLNVRWDDDVYLTGPAELIGEGHFFYLE